MCCEFAFSKSGREKLGNVVAVTHVILALFGLSFTFVALFIYIHVENFSALFPDYNRGTLPAYILSIGIIIFVLHLISAKVFNDIGSNESKDKVKGCVSFLMLLQMAMSIVVLGASITCFAHVSVVEESFGNGLMHSMVKYKHDRGTKNMIDVLQMEYECCGSRSYKDWFGISWFDLVHRSKSDLMLSDAILYSWNKSEKQQEIKEDKGIHVEIKKGRYYSSSVPFSCCSKRFRGPCHHRLMGKDVDSVYYRGCTVPLKEFFEDDVLVPTAIMGLICFVFEVLVVCLCRIQHTAMINAEDSGDEDGPSKGYVCQPCFTPDDPVTKYVNPRKKSAGKPSDDSQDNAIDNAGLPDMDAAGDFLDRGFNKKDKAGGKKSKKDKKDKTEKKDKKDKSGGKERRSRSKERKNDKKGKSKSRSKSKSKSRSKSPKSKPPKKSPKMKTAKKRKSPSPKKKKAKRSSPKPKRRK